MFVGVIVGVGVGGENVYDIDEYDIVDPPLTQC